MEKGDFRISTMASSNIAVLLTVGVITVVLIRIIYVIYRSSKSLHSKSPRFLSTLVVLGSGGHTAEMLNLLYVLLLQKERFKPRYYIAAATDNMSLQKAKMFEDSLVGKEALEEVGGAEFLQIYRSREVGQSYITSVGTTLIAIAHALWLMIKIRPQVILCNGPGTCVPLCVIAFLFKVYWLHDFFEVLDNGTYMLLCGVHGMFVLVKGDNASITYLDDSSSFWRSEEEIVRSTKELTI